jgi:hypothetical protein
MWSFSECARADARFYLFVWLVMIGLIVPRGVSILSIGGDVISWQLVDSCESPISGLKFSPAWNVTPPDAQCFEGD